MTVAAGPFKVLTVTDGRSIMSLEIRRPAPFGREAAANGTAQVSGAAKTAVRIGRSPALQKERWTIGQPTIPISQRRLDGPTNRYRLLSRSLKSGRSATSTVRYTLAPNQRACWPVRTAVKIGYGYELLRITPRPAAGTLEVPGWCCTLS